MKDAEGIKTVDSAGLLEQLARQLGVTANAKYVYAEPVERDGVTLVPVGKASYGLGGGSGRKNGQKGSGGGGGASVTPVGYIEVKDGETRFRRIVDVAGIAQLIGAGSLALFTIFWGISKLKGSSRKDRGCD